MSRLPRLLLAALPLLAGPALGQEDRFENEPPGFTPFREAVAFGDLTGDAVPAADASVDGCRVTFITRAVAPDLGVPLTLTVTADATQLDYAQWAPEVSEDRVTAMLPSAAPVALHMSISTGDDAVRSVFTEALPARCSQTGCEATVPSPGFAFIVYERGFDVARGARDALRAYAATCAEG
ncbi:hypothetical protein [Pseudoponticoccus marisrubri]|uniref:Uncharacterized protein n=1 Tax=Pseudoponticoccus marisrubri TaxID=1685382 RepID=A0A0W7WEB6_9RHOB|nr:hypothetical protein [Pseudoponticoccus marisrubri]KUF08882.1 hypothetical protein AVJ23_20560 [Pseudoponticoccus marisrubri]